MITNELIRADESMKAGSWLTEALTDPATAKSEEPEHASVCRALGITEPLWNWWDRPENDIRRRRFGSAMSGTNKIQPPKTILTCE